MEAAEGSSAPRKGVLRTQFKKHLVLEVGTFGATMPDWPASLSQPRQQDANLALPGFGTSPGQARHCDNRFSWSAYSHEAV